MRRGLFVSMLTAVLMLASATVAFAADGNYYFLTNGTTGGTADVSFHYGKADDIVLVGDWDGDGDDTLAVRRGKRYYLNNSLTGGNADIVFDYGREDDEVFVGDWDGDGDDTLAVRRGRTFYVSNTLTGGTADKTFVYGREGDIVIVGDWDGKNGDTFGVRRGNEYFLNNTLEGGVADIHFAYGRTGDQVFTGDWDGDHDDTLAVRRDNVFYLNNTLTGGTADITYGYGRASDVVLVGDWNNDHRDTPGLRRTGVTFAGNGQYEVGRDIPKGLYWAESRSEGCYWERQSGFSGDIDDVITNGFRSDGNWIVEILGSDAGFFTDGCYTWREVHLTDTGSPNSSMDNGTYRVGIDILPGTYKGTVSSDGCYWERLADFQHMLESIKANDFRSDSGASVFVTIDPSDVGFLVHGCGTLVRQ